MLGRFVIGLAAAGLLAYGVGLVLYADRFPPLGEAADRELVLLFVAATVAASILHVAACLAAHRRPPRLRHVLIVAGAVRVLLLFGAPDPILEGDPQRARFDARLVNQGIHPYEFKPSHLGDGEPTDLPMEGPQIERLIQARAAMTASSDAPRPDQVRRPDLRTNATPLAIEIAALGDRFKPHSTRGLAYLILVADALAIFFLVLALRRLCLPVGWVLVYAWSPVLLKEAYCSLAPDVFLMPALALLLWLIASGRRFLLALPLALCASLRFSLLALIPVFARRTGALGVLAAAVLFVAPFLPLQGAEVPLHRFAEGNLHVWRHYEYNSLLENLLRSGLSGLEDTAENSLSIAGVPMVQPGDALHVFLAKVVGLLVVAGVVTYLVIRGGQGGESSAVSEERQGIVDLFTVLVALLLVSPVLHPWLALWLLPVLAVRQMGVSWLALPGLVTLSYLTHLRGPDQADLTFLGDEFSFRIVEYGAFGVLLVVDLLFRRMIFPRADEGEPIRRALAVDAEFAAPEPPRRAREPVAY